jgi:chemotaxis protein MotA
MNPMSSKNVVGLLFCIIIFLAGFVIHGNIAMYFNFSGFLIVIGGTMGAALISYRLDRLAITYKVLKHAFNTTIKEPEDIVEILVDLSVKSKFKGILSLEEDEEETSILFLRRALGFLVDGMDGEHIRESLSTEIFFFKMRREVSERVMRNMGAFAPAFGLVGSVVGLIGMLAGVGDTKVILATVPIALTSTLYGVIFGNFFFMPFATAIRERTEQEILLQKIIMEGVIAIESEINPRMLELKLKCFITPSSRKIKLVSLQRIQERFNIKPQQQGALAPATQPVKNEPPLSGQR